MKNGVKSSTFAGEFESGVYGASREAVRRPFEEVQQSECCKRVTETPVFNVVWRAN